MRSAPRSEVGARQVLGVDLRAGLAEDARVALQRVLFLLQKPEDRLQLRRYLPVDALHDRRFVVAAEMHFADLVEIFL